MSETCGETRGLYVCMRKKGHKIRHKGSDGRWKRRD